MDGVVTSWVFFGVGVGVSVGVVGVGVGVGAGVASVGMLVGWWVGRYCVYLCTLTGTLLPVKRMHAVHAFCTISLYGAAARLGVSNYATHSRANRAAADRCVLPDNDISCSPAC